MYDEYAEVEYDYGVALLYLDGVDDFARVLPVLRAWHEVGEPLLLRAAKDLPKPKVNRLATTAEDPETGAFQEFRPRSWERGLREDIGTLGVSWAFDDEPQPVYQAGQRLSRFRLQPDHMMLAADLSQHGPRVDVAALLEVLHRVADVADPVYGEIIVGCSTQAPATALDRVLRRLPWVSQTEGRTLLRGYEWVTVCPKELVARLGGASALRSSGAFYEVTPLTCGAALLRATGTVDEYDQAAADRVFAALRPVLPGA